MHEPRISVVIPTRNRATCLGELVATLRAQTLEEWEAVLVDDGSEPDEQRRIRELTRDDPRLRVLRRETEPPGACHCRNLGLRAARADLVVFFDDDDLLSPACLEARVRAMDDAPDLDFLVFPYERFRVTPGDTGSRHRAFASEQAIDGYLRIRPPWHTGSAVWRRAFLERVGGWNEAVASWQDWEFGIRALCLRPRCGARDEPHFFVRIASERHRNISGAWSPKHVRSWPVAADSALAHLRDAGLLTGARARLMGKLLLFIAERHVEIGDRPGALRLWSRARGDGLVSRAEWIVGRGVLRLVRVPPVRERIRSVLSLLMAVRGAVERGTGGSGAPSSAARRGK